MSENQATDRAKTPGIAVAAFVTSLFGFLCGIPAVVGLVLGLMARKRAKLVQRGVGLATAAIVISSIWLAVVVVGVVVGIANSGNGGGASEGAGAESGSSAPASPSQASTPQPDTAVEASSPAPTPTPTLEPRESFLAMVRNSGPTEARDAIAARKDAALVKFGESACKQIQVRGALAGYGLFYGSQEAKPGEAPWIAQAAVQHLCPELGVSAEQIAGYEANFDQWVVDLAQELPFSLMLSEAKEQGGVGKYDDDKNMMKNAFMFCGVLNTPKPWEFMESLDGVQPAGSTPTLLEYKGILNSAYFYICPEVKFSPQQVAKKWADRNLG